MASPKMSTKQGHEFQFGTNHLGHFALTNALLPALQAANKWVLHLSSGSNKGYVHDIIGLWYAFGHFALTNAPLPALMAVNK